MSATANGGAAKPRRWLSFDIGPETYAIDLTEVREIVPCGEIVAVPDADADVLGITALRGQIVGVMDGARRLGLSASTRHPPEAARLVVFTWSGGSVALRVDALGDVFEAADEALQPPPPGRALRPQEPVLGVVAREQGFIAVLDAHRLMRVEA